jgi:hypothetical protein
MIETIAHIGGCLFFGLCVINLGATLWKAL